MSPRLPGRHDQPLEPMEMTEAAIVQFQHDISSGFDGAAQWRRDCTCEHAKAEHQQGLGGCTRCTCREYTAGQHERLDLWLHPDVVKWLPPGVLVEAVGNQYDRQGFCQFRLVRDHDSSYVMVVRSGVRETTLRPEGE